RLLRVIASQELLSGGEHSRSQANRFDEQPQRVSHCGVIIHDEYGRRRCCHALPPRVEGSRKTKQAPRGTFGRKLRVPRCCAIIVRLIASPSPVPSGLVVLNGSNSCGRRVAETPGPVSDTDSSTSPSSDREV